jgi:tetratricopeptide (TPR) repeat protein
MTPDDKSSLKATTLGRLANALEALAERELGTTRIKEAIGAYNDALKLTSRRENPLSWASFQNDLGGALAILGERDTNASALNESARAYHQALLEYTREKVPLKWAMVKHNLAATLWALGTRRGRLRNLEKAISCFLEALEERTSDKRPFEWAMTQHSLGVALLDLGRMTEDEIKLKAACVALECSLTVNTKQANIVKWIESSLSLANAKGELGELTTDLVLLEQAIGIHRGVAQELTLGDLPRLRSLTQMSLAENLLRRGKGVSNSEEVREAVQTCRFLVGNLAFKDEPFQRAISAFQLSRALLDLSASTEEPDLLQEAAHILDDAWAELHEQGRLPKRERVLAQNRLTEEKLREYGEQAVQNDQKNGRTWMFDIALSVLLHFLGSNWVEQYLFKNGPLKPPPRSVDPFRQFVIGREGYALAEMLFNLQHETGFEGIRERLIAGNIESVISEMEAARFLKMYGENFRFVEPTGKKGFDYDLEVFRPGLTIQCEVKAKAETTMSSDSISRRSKKPEPNCRKTHLEWYSSAHQQVRPIRKFWRLKLRSTRRPNISFGVQRGLSGPYCLPKR